MRRRARRTPRASNRSWTRLRTGPRCPSKSGSGDWFVYSDVCIVCVCIIYIHPLIARTKRVPNTFVLLVTLNAHICPPPPPLPSMYVPGQIVHIYYHNGLFKACMVSRDHPALQVCRCMQICYTYVCVCVYMYGGIYVWTCVGRYVCMCVCVYVYMYVMYVGICAFGHVEVYMRVCVCLYVCMYVHRYVDMWRSICVYVRVCM